MPIEPLPGRDDAMPRSIADGLELVVRRLGSASVDVTTELFASWPDLVGDAVATAGRPVSLRDGVLVVAVDDPAWATQLRFLAPQLLGTFAERFGADAVRSIEVRVRPR